MTDRKNSLVKDEDIDNDNDKEWEFTAVKPKVKYESLNVESQVQETKMVTRKNATLTLDETSLPKMRSRSAMAKELQNLSDTEIEDVDKYAPIPKRGIAFILDCAFIFFLAYAVKFILPLERILIQYFLDKYKLQFIFPEFIVLKALMIISGFFAAIFFVVIPLSFFNLSFGKKIMGLRVRGERQYTISFGKAIKRELIFKPISIAIVAGLITPLFNKKKLSIHDMLAGTYVIEE